MVRCVDQQVLLKSREMTCYFVIVGHNDNPIFEQDFSRPTESGKVSESVLTRRHARSFNLSR